MMQFSRVGLAVLVSALALCAPSLAQAQSFMVPDGVWSNLARTMTGNGDVGTVEKGGTISGPGVSMPGDEQWLFNHGTMRGSTVVYVTGSNASIVNTGTIEVGSGSNVGIESYGDFLFVDNRGLLETGGDGTGVRSYGAHAWIVNSGAIDADTGIDSRGADALIVNDGTIDAHWGIYSTGANTHIVNSGYIGGSSYPIYITAGDVLLSLLPGSVLEGRMRVQASAQLALDIAPGLSTAVYFYSSLPTAIETHGAPLVVNGPYVYTADVTPQLAQDDMLADLTGGIFSAIGGRKTKNAARAPLAYAPESAAVRELSIFRVREPPAREVWLKGFGGWRDREAEGASADYAYDLAGFVSGMDVFASPDATAGIFVGGAWGGLDVPLSQSVDTQSVFGGIYATKALGMATIEMALAAGWSGYDGTRRINNNMVVGGIEHAEADYDGWFVSPHLKATLPFDIGGQRVEAEASARYAGLFLDGYSETGSAANLTLDDRNVHLFVGRAALSVPFEYIHGDGARARFIPTLGLEGRVQFGDGTVTGTLAGIRTTFDADNGETLGGFVGLGAEYETAGGLTFHAEGEALFENDGSRFLAKGGISAVF